MHCVLLTTYTIYNTQDKSYGERERTFGAHARLTSSGIMRESTSHSNKNSREHSAKHILGPYVKRDIDLIRNADQRLPSLVTADVTIGKRGQHHEFLSRPFDL